MLTLPLASAEYLKLPINIIVSPFGNIKHNYPLACKIMVFLLDCQGLFGKKTKKMIHPVNSILTSRMFVYDLKKMKAEINYLAELGGGISMKNHRHELSLN